MNFKIVTVISFLLIGIQSCSQTKDKKQEILSSENIVSLIPIDTVNTNIVPEEVINELDKFEQMYVLYLSQFEGIYSLLGDYSDFYYNKNISDNFKGNLGKNRVVLIDFDDEYGEIKDEYAMHFTKDGLLTKSFLNRSTTKGNIKLNDISEFQYKDSYVTSFAQFSKTPSYSKSEGSSVDIIDGNPIIKTMNFVRDLKGKITNVVFKEIIFKSELTELETQIQAKNPEIDLSKEETLTNYTYTYYTSKLNPKSYFIKVDNFSENSLESLFSEKKYIVIEIKDLKVARVWNFNKEEEKLVNYVTLKYPDLNTVIASYYGQDDINSESYKNNVNNIIKFNNRSRVAEIKQVRLDSKSGIQFKYLFNNNNLVEMEEYKLEFNDDGELESNKLKRKMYTAPSLN